MRIKLGASCYATDIDQTRAFYYRGDVYVMVAHGNDHCRVRKVACRGENDMLTFLSSEIENFNSYADVKPFEVLG